jgi:hypothetical protein
MAVVAVSGEMPANQSEGSHYGEDGPKWKLMQDV